MHFYEQIKAWEQTMLTNQTIQDEMSLFLVSKSISSGYFFKLVAPHGIIRIEKSTGIVLFFQIFLLTFVTNLSVLALYSLKK